MAGTTRAIVGATGLLPAAILVFGGVTRAGIPMGWIHPLLLAGGLTVSLVLNLSAVASGRLAKAPGGIDASLHLRLVGQGANWAELLVAATLATAIAGYLLFENFQPR